MKTLLYPLLALTVLTVSCKKEIVTTVPASGTTIDSKTKIIYPWYIVRPFGYDLTKTHVDFMKPSNNGC